ncbi:uncharacterized protein LOC126667221 [Mercurialis annua]|uniref:uncharacterized protein LOC126667221 n=1 Tax=Mercurialis annua TaxID=3986 RepID=UPI00215EA175|nr:uncharacterized protein LOC126667221 [Mercurialis annua]XP_050216143.1 uncharacterized protein LOC126667221 [Mercurialis annua]XP_050216144.1 uncharacterized protein LOC126667221 [Mercurialis annua]XP_050216145.1 uncharacterized protein LOC126667221 [Mercurialis annua]
MSSPARSEKDSDEAREGNDGEDKNAKNISSFKKEPSGKLPPPPRVSLKGIIFTYFATISHTLAPLKKVRKKADNPFFPIGQKREVLSSGSRVNMEDDVPSMKSPKKDVQVSMVDMLIGKYGASVSAS